MKRLVVAAIAFFVILAASCVDVAFASQGPDHKVGICHRTASDTNPYVYIEVDVAALSAHIGPAAHPPKHGRYDYLADSREDCNAPEVTPSPSPSAASPSPAPTGTSGPSPAPSPTATPVASAAPSTAPSPAPSSGPSASPGPTQTPASSPSPVASMTPTPSPSASSGTQPSLQPSASPSPTTDYPSVSPPPTDAAEANPSPQSYRDVFIILFFITLGGTAYALRHPADRRRR